MSGSPEDMVWVDVLVGATLSFEIPRCVLAEMRECGTIGEDGTMPNEEGEAWYLLDALMEHSPRDRMARHGYGDVEVNTFDVTIEERALGA